MPPYVASHEPGPSRDYAPQPRRPGDVSNSLEVFSPHRRQSNSRMVSSSSLEVFSPHRRQSNSRMVSDKEDTLQVAENYILEARRSSSRKSSASHRSRRSLQDLLVDETPKPAAVLATTSRRKSVKEASPKENSKRGIKVKSSISPGQVNIGRASPPPFSLDDSDIGSHLSLSSSPVQLKRIVPPARSSTDADVPISDLELDGPNIGNRMSISSPPAVSSSDGEVRHEVVHGRKSGGASPVVKGSAPSETGGFEHRVESSIADVPDSANVRGCETETEQGEDHHLRFGASDAACEWNEVFRRSGRRDVGSPDSLSNESFKTSKSNISSTSSRGSLSDEAISERTAAWGNGVAKLVLKNSSQETTPRTSDGSSADGVHSGQKIPRVSKHVKDALSSFQLAFVVCDVVDSGHPILFASAGFFQMTGYSAEEVIGRNCRFMQGVDTDAKEVGRIRQALKNGEAYSGTILNYRKDGSPFWNLLNLSPIHDDKGVLIKYMGMQAEVKHPTIAARRKMVAGEGKDVPRSTCESIAELTPSGQYERGADVPIFTPPASRVTGSPSDDIGSKRYSLTHGIRGSKRYSLTTPPATTRHSISHVGRWSVDSNSVAAGVTSASVGLSKRDTVPTAKKSPSSHGPPQQQRQASKNSFASRPVYWLLTAARILEDEISRLGCDPDLAKECHEKFKRHEERRRADRLKNQSKGNPNKMNRVASGVLGLFRKLERKVFKRETSRSRGVSNRVNAYDFESDVEIDDDFKNDFPMVGSRKTPTKPERQGLRCESMPHMSPTRRVALSSSSVSPADLHRARSSRYLSSAMSDRLEKRISASYTNEFVPDRQQFCIVHE